MSKWGLKFSSELVTGGPGSASLTPWPVYFLVHQCFPKLNPVEMRWDQIIWVHVHALVTPQRVTILVNRANAQQNQMIKRLLKVHTFFFRFFTFLGGFLGGASGTRTCLPVQEMDEMDGWSLGGEHPLEEGMASHSSTLAWRSSWTEEPGGLQSTGSQSRTWRKRLS